MAKKILFIKSVFIFLITLFSIGTIAQEALTLEKARELALQRNTRLRMEEERVNAAKAAQLQANTAGKPTVDGSVTGFYFGKPINQVLPEYGVSPSVSVTQPIYTGGKIKLSKEAAGKAVELQQQQKALTTSEVLFNTEKAYWDVVAAKEKIKLANQFHKQLEALHTDLNNQFSAGLIYKNDVLRVEVQLNEAKMSLLRSEDGLEVARLVLTQVTGIERDSVFTVKDSVEGIFERITPDTAYAVVYGNRPEVKLLEKNIELSVLQQKILNAEFKPTIGLSASGLGAFGKAGINPGNASNNAMASYYGMVSLSIPIFDWGSRKQKIKQQQFGIAAQQLQLQEIKEQMSIEVRQAYLALNQAAKNVELSGASLAQANENLKLSNDRFQAGTIVGKDVLEAQTIWEQAVISIIDAKIYYRVSEAALKKALGMLK